MFDNVSNPNAGIPKNLPVEPDDILAEVEKTENLPPTPPNALDTGRLKPAGTVASGSMPAAPSLAGSAATPASVYTVKAPIVGKILLLVFLAAILGGLGFGGYWFYQYYQAGNLNSTPSPSAALPETGAPETLVPENMPTDENEETAISSDINVDMNNDRILFGEPVDLDQDGLDNVREQELGTNPQIKDTDGDGLSDFDEVMVWRTNPNSQDTDGDGYLDLDEVTHGYNPLGPGKMLPEQSSPTTTPTATVK